MAKNTTLTAPIFPEKIGAVRVSDIGLIKYSNFLLFVVHLYLVHPPLEVSVIGVLSVLMVGVLVSK